MEEDKKNPSPPVGAWGVPTAPQPEPAPQPAPARPSEPVLERAPQPPPAEVIIERPLPRISEPVRPPERVMDRLAERPLERDIVRHERTETVQRSLDDRPLGERPDERGRVVAPERRGARGRGWLILVVLAAIVGMVFAGISTSDFVEHLDGQTHEIHCSINPGADQTDEATGCAAAMFSPYSSFFRTSMWGGVPISLLAFAVFSFLAALALALALKKDLTRRDTLFLLLGTLVPVGASVVYATIAGTQLGTFCEVCIGIYTASGLVAVLALIAHLRAWPSDDRRLPWGRWALWFGEGVVVVALMLGLYVAWVPSERPSVENGCGALVEEPAADESFVISLPAEPGAIPSLEVLDPLCNFCRAFDKRLAASGLDKKLARKVVVFPMDTCIPNDMIRQRLHPGACTVSYAMLCAPQSAQKILDYAFTEQERLLELGKTNDAALKADLEQKFPEVKGCIGSAKVKAELTKARNWAARNALELSTPQLFVAGTQVCQQNTDLGLEFTLTRALQKAGYKEP